MYVLAHPRRPAVDRNHPRLVNHLVPDDDDAGALFDAGAVAVDGGKNRADDAARDAAIVVAVEFSRVVLAGEPSALLRLTPLAIGRERRQASVRRMDHQRGRVRPLRAALGP